MTNEFNFKKIRVLAIDDDRGALYLLKALINTLGCQCDFENCIEVAVEKLKTNTYDICLTDINMPVASGFQITEFIHKNINKDMPVIAVTASILPKDKNLCFEAGMNGFLSKPMDIETLKAEIKRHFTSEG